MKFAASSSGRTGAHHFPVSVNGAGQGFLVGVRAPDSDYVICSYKCGQPIMDVNDANIACNTGYHSPVSTEIIEIAAGDKAGALWGHVLGGEQMPNDPDNPIASSHKGPIMAYLAKVDDAASAEPAGLEWFKVAEDGLYGSGLWGVDRMINSGGWTYFTMPSCVAPGNYLLRVETIALHSAYDEGQAQFYMSCAQINISGSGTATGETVSFPGAYSSTDPGILISIYDNKGVPNNNGQAYEIPGPEPLSC
ncbi:hypothetical protein FQN54_003581 [Arachnomyces sp. PD_36]|nr:hypothetical protein FQN54_003581 [Arachnomyces sp. PD_36]